MGLMPHKKRFAHGRIVWTPGAAALMAEGVNGGSLLERHLTGDWGDLCAEDKQRNDDAVAHRTRVFSSYDTEHGRLWIITEWDRSATTLLLPEEY